MYPPLMFFEGAQSLSSNLSFPALNTVVTCYQRALSSCDVITVAIISRYSSHFGMLNIHIATLIVLYKMDSIETSCENWDSGFAMSSPIFDVRTYYVFHEMFNRPNLPIMMLSTYWCCNLSHAFFAAWQFWFERTELSCTAVMMFNGTFVNVCWRSTILSEPLSGSYVEIQPSISAPINKFLLAILDISKALPPFCFQTTFAFRVT